ncbi:MAG: hypothetical protein A3J70_02235 [Elusimicrobia bacterium RIFCSPHIGHO2_02_FULL_61_10]|nr:MAG: hypothetical protein A3J70_02235 [Elusimicrobia bacterium RIFCSPHIGHO2_02_FULL_61_10]
MRKFCRGLAVLALGPALFSAAFAAPAVVLIPSGSVEVRTGSGAWQAVSARGELTAGSEVRTTKDSTAQIIFSDGSRIALSSNAQFLVEKTDRREASFRLGMGRLRAYFSGVFASRMNIRTPTAVCSVRGTEFEMSAGEKTEISVDEGHLEVRDNQGHNAVVTSEESIAVGAAGLEAPQLVSLSDVRARDAARPAAVSMELAKDKTRGMFEELRNRELKANEAQLGKDVVDAFGQRVRLEEYVLRPASNEFKLVFMSFRKNRFDWGHLYTKFNSAIPDDLTRMPALVAGTFFSKTSPSNWLKYMEVYLTNTIDSVKETITLGNPTLINFSGYGASVGSRYYPVSLDYKQIFTGPGVPGGAITQFQLTQDFGQTVASQFEVRQKVINNVGVLDTLVHVTLDPTNVVDVANGFTGIYGDDKVGNPTIDPVTSSSFPSGRTKADLLVRTDYRDGSFVSTEKILVTNDGKIIDFNDPSSDSFTKEGNVNLEIVAKSSYFQGRKIDVMIAPEILAQKKNGTTDATLAKPQ